MVATDSTLLQERIISLETLLGLLEKAVTTSEKLKILDRQAEVISYLKQTPLLSHHLKTRTPQEAFIIKSILALGQGPIVFHSINEKDQLSHLQALLKVLSEVEHSYNAIGGIIGYHLQILKQIIEKQTLPTLNSEANFTYRKPEGIDLSHDTEEVRRSIRWGIDAIPQIAEMYPVGGAGDRLNLRDEITEEALPAAELLFGGRSLLEGLIRDLQAREYLHYKIHGTQVNVPIAMMTSDEKDNHHHIIRICTEKQWFGRSRENYHFFIQPLVPVVTIKGDWVMQNPLQLMLKPGGHGLLWKCALDSGVFDKFASHHCHQALVRQINNPAAGIDHGLLAFLGFGTHYKKEFGFASCARRLNTSEGMDVLIEKRDQEGVEYRISNIEYTEFKCRGIKDVAESPESPYSIFPANTNILFVNLSVIREILPQCPIPGMLINMKNSIPHLDSKGNVEEISAGRLESTMQNIADCIIDRFAEPLKAITPTTLRTFITYNERRKTISVTKKTHTADQSIHETPEGCYYELLQNHRDLLTHYCHMQLPPLGSEEEYLKHGPGFNVAYHPALGPLYSVIAQKIQRGSLASGAEMQLEIAEVDLQDLSIKGSLLITAESILGKQEGGLIRYGEETGKCHLHNVVVENQGIDRNAPNQFWKNQISRHESLQIILKGNAEFFAENITIKGAHQIEVPDGHRMVAEMQESKLIFRLEKISGPTWFWAYSFDYNDRIQLKKMSREFF